MKLTKLGLPAVEWQAAGTQDIAVSKVLGRIKDQKTANQLLQLDEQVASVRTQLATSRALLRKDANQAQVQRKVQRLSNALLAHQAAVRDAKKNLCPSDALLVQRLTDARRKQRAKRKRVSVQRQSTSRLGLIRGAKLTGGGPIRDR